MSLRRSRTAHAALATASACAVPPLKLAVKAIRSWVLDESAPSRYRARRVEGDRNPLAKNRDVPSGGSPNERPSSDGRESCPPTRAIFFYPPAPPPREGRRYAFGASSVDTPWAGDESPRRGHGIDAAAGSRWRRLGQRAAAGLPPRTVFVSPGVVFPLPKNRDKRADCVPRRSASSDLGFRRSPTGAPRCL